MRDPAERGVFADAIADGRCDNSGPIAHSDSFRFTVANPAADDRAAQRAVGHGRVGARGRNAALPLV
jgi:hypothetical protein